MRPMSDGSGINVNKRSRGWNGPPPPRPGPRGPRINLTGQKFGRLTILSHGGSDDFGHARWNCRCQCGALSVALGINLSSGKTLSCGSCRNQETAEKVAIIKRRNRLAAGLPSGLIRGPKQPIKPVPADTLTAEEIQAIRLEHAKGGISQHQQAKKYGVSQVAISKVIRHQIAAEEQKRRGRPTLNPEDRIVKRLEAAYRKPIDPAKRLSDADAEQIFCILSLQLPAGGAQ
jgi:predicted DNA-binding protein (UPF0251 family)